MVTDLQLSEFRSAEKADPCSYFALFTHQLHGDGLPRFGKYEWGWITGVVFRTAPVQPNKIYLSGGLVFMITDLIPWKSFTVTRQFSNGGLYSFQVKTGEVIHSCRGNPGNAKHNPWVDQFGLFQNWFKNRRHLNFAH